MGVVASSNKALVETNNNNPTPTPKEELIVTRFNGNDWPKHVVYMDASVDTRIKQYKDILLRIVHAPYIGSDGHKTVYIESSVTEFGAVQTVFDVFTVFAAEVGAERLDTTKFENIDVFVRFMNAPPNVLTNLRMVFENAGMAPTFHQLTDRDHPDDDYYKFTPEELQATVHPNAKSARKKK